MQPSCWDCALGSDDGSVARELDEWQFSAGNPDGPSWDGSDSCVVCAPPHQGAFPWAVWTPRQWAELKAGFQLAGMTTVWPTC